MRQYEWSRRVGWAAVLCALILRLYSAGAVDRLSAFLAKPDIAAFLIYIETGRDVRSLSSGGEPAYPPESPPAMPRETEALPVEALPEEEAAALPEPVTVWSETGEVQENAAISVSYACELRPDMEALLAEPLALEVVSEAPAVLILSTHSTESYTKNGEDYEESSPYRTLDDRYNMLSLGAFVADRLEAAGIRVLRDDSLHDYPSYNGAYTHARKAIQANLAACPTICLVLDLHRDAAESGSGQLRTAAEVAGKPSAQLMLVMGTNASGLKHDRWQENLSLALKLQSELEHIAPGITRPLNLRAQRFNQDLSPGALLVEIGAAGNTHEEALRAAEVLAQGILRLLGSPSE